MCSQFSRRGKTSCRAVGGAREKRNGKDKRPFKKKKRKNEKTTRRTYTRFARRTDDLQPASRVYMSDRSSRVQRQTTTAAGPTDVPAIIRRDNRRDTTTTEHTKNVSEEKTAGVSGAAETGRAEKNVQLEIPNSA